MKLRPSAVHLVGLLGALYGCGSSGGATTMSAGTAGSSTIENDGAGGVIPSSGAMTGSASSGSGSPSSSGANAGSASGSDTVSNQTGSDVPVGISGAASGEAPGDAGSGAGTDATMDTHGGGGDANAPPVDVGDAGFPAPISGSPYSGTTTSITVTSSRTVSAGRMVPGFAGFSFEKTHMTDGFFTGTNAPLIALFRLLGPGFVRIGANDVNRANWQADAKPVAAGTTSKTVGTADIDGLAAFLKATDWKVMYGLNITPTGGTASDVAEATYAASTIGSNLYTFEMGNEPADYPSFKSEWETLQAGIKAAVPTAEFNGPESNTTSDTTMFAKDEASKIVLITHHHYVGGAGTGNANIGYLLEGDTGTTTRTQAFVQAATANKLRDGFRWGEDNSFYHHGEPGVSNAFASALWGIEHMFKAAESGAVGVNFHGGGQNMDGNSCPSGPSSCSLPFVYSPIDEVNSAVTAAAPLYYGMLFVSRAGIGNMLTTTVAAGGVNVFAHTVALADGSTNVIIVNNDANTGVSAKVNLGATVSQASAVYLQAPSLGALSGVTFAGAGVSAAGEWTPKTRYTVPVSGSTMTVVVPPASVALVFAH